MVLVKKKDGSTRFYVDYCLWNSMTKKDNYPLPQIDNTFDTLAGSTLDLKRVILKLDWTLRTEKRLPLLYPGCKNSL